MCINNHKVNTFKEKYFDHVGADIGKKRGMNVIFLLSIFVC